MVVRFFIPVLPNHGIFIIRKICECEINYYNLMNMSIMFADFYFC